MNLTFSKLVPPFDLKTVTMINTLMRKLHSEAKPLSIADLIDATKSGDIYVGRDSKGGIQAVGILIYQNLLTHSVIRIHNLEANCEDASAAIHELISVMVDASRRDYPHSEIQIDVLTRNMSRQNFLTSLGFILQNKVSFRLKPVKE